MYVYVCQWVFEFVGEARRGAVGKGGVDVGEDLGARRNRGGEIGEVPGRVEGNVGEGGAVERDCMYTMS